MIKRTESGAILHEFEFQLCHVQLCDLEQVS